MDREAPGEGRCACGELRYRVNAAPMFVHACHCTECQRLSGSAFALNAIVEADQVELLAGGTEAVPVIGASGKVQTIHRCPRCRVALWSHYPQAGPLICFVRAGTLDDPSRVTPDIAIYTSTRLSWLPLPAGLPAVPEFYDPREHWPAESLARWARVKERARAQP